MEVADDCGYTFLQNWLDDSWWSEALGSGLFEIGNHSWDHVHGTLPTTALTMSDTRNDFTVVDNYIDADREIRKASDFVRLKAGSCGLFAYPFGHTNEFLVREYMPERQAEHGCLAAFGAQGHGVRVEDGVWNISRMICGHHWREPEGLLELIGLK